jgi:hypothetical protein
MFETNIADSRTKKSHLNVVKSFGVFALIYVSGYVVLYHILEVGGTMSLAVTFGWDFLCGTLALRYFYHATGRRYYFGEGVLFISLCFIFLFTVGLVEVSFEQIYIPLVVAVSELFFILAAIMRVFWSHGKL